MGPGGETAGPVRSEREGVLGQEALLRFLQEAGWAGLCRIVWFK